MRGQAVASRAADFLIIAFNALRQIEVNNETYVRFVDAHAERNSGNDNLHVIANEYLLIFTPLCIFKPCVIRTDRIPF